MIRRSSALLLFTLFLTASTIIASESNEDFVNASLRAYFGDVLALVPISSGEELYIDYSPPLIDNLNVSGAALGESLRSLGITRTTLSGDFRGTGIRFDLSELRFSYENRNSTLFSRGDLHRVLKVSASFELIRDGSPVWENYLIKEYDDMILLSEREMLEDKSSELFHSDLPPGPLQKLWEPVIVTSVVGGLVYLFFASR